jgi:hypothetical protein
LDPPETVALRQATLSTTFEQHTMSDTFDNTSFEQLLNDDSFTMFDSDFCLPDFANDANWDTAPFLAPDFDLDAFTNFDPGFSPAGVANDANMAEASFLTVGLAVATPLDAEFASFANGGPDTASRFGNPVWDDGQWTGSSVETCGLRDGSTSEPVIDGGSLQLAHEVSPFFLS